LILATLSTVCYTVSTDGAHIFTAGQRVNQTNSPSSFIWRLKTESFHKKLPVTVDYWAKPREPNNDDGVEFCLVLWAGNNYFWHDGNCDRRYNAVCEIDIT